MEIVPRYPDNIHIELRAPELTTESPKCSATEIHISTTVHAFTITVTG